MLMESSHYLDSEILKHSNYPEVQQVLGQIAEIDAFLMVVNSAVAGYVEGMDAKVFIDTHALETHITLCREVLMTLGIAENPCFDIILNLRTVLENFHEILYTRRKYGAEYVDYKMSSSEFVLDGDTYGS